jgi:gliding motility-associated-like protein
MKMIQVRGARIDSNVFDPGCYIFIETDASKYSGTFITRNNLTGDLNVMPYWWQQGYLRASGSFVKEISGNRLTAVENNGGIVVVSDSTLIANNFVQTQGQGPSIGIDLHGQHNRLLFNSLHVLNQDSLNSACMWIRNATGHLIKNNIFANNGTGYPVSVPGPVLNTEWDYNNYYSPTDKVVRYQSQRYFNLQSWGMAIGGEANALNVNPFFAAVDSYKPYQRALNGAGIAAGNILLDIEGEIRNQQAPDIGADEFMIDFGITELISPGISCDRNQIDSVTIYLRQFGDVPFVDLRLAYQVNGGPIFTDTIPGSILNDLIYTFSAPTNLMGFGTYTLKIWLIDTYDDNVNNDTLVAIRRTFPTPTMDIRPLKCFETVTFDNRIMVPPPHVMDSVWWYFGDGDSIKAIRPTHIYAGYGKYNVRVVAYASSGCIEDTIFELDLTPPAIVNILGADTLCVGDVYHARASDSLLVYNWQVIGGQVLGSSTDSIVAIRFGQTGRQGVVLSFTDLDSCVRSADTLWVQVLLKDSVDITPTGNTYLCKGDTALLQLSGLLDSLSVIQWFRNDTLLTAASGLQIAVADTGSYYAVSFHVNGCADTTSVFTLLHHPQMNPVVNVLSGSPNLCPGDTIELQAFVQGLTHVYWYEQTANSLIDSASIIRIATAGTYYAIVVDSNGCIDSTSPFVISQYPIIPVQLIMPLASICAGDSVLLTFSSVATQAIVWYQDNAIIASGVDSFFARATGWYRLSALDSNGCTHFSDSLFLEVVDLEAPEVTGQIAYCYGDTLRLTAPDVAGRSYFWLLPDSSFIQGNEYLVINVDSSHLGSYRVFFTQDGCYSDTTQLNIEVVPALPIPSVAPLFIVCEEESWQLAPATIPFGADVVWIFPNLDTVTTELFTLSSVSLSDSGDYQIFFKQGNCMSTIVPFKLRVFEKDAIDFPNAFTPNGDGYNDEFGPMPAVYENEYDLTILSRWGSTLYHTTQFGATWDGKTGGLDTESGTYYYAVRYKNCNGESVTKQGALKLIR